MGFDRCKLVVLLVAALVMAAGAAYAQTEAIEGFEARSLDGMPYRLFVPSNYDPNRRHPLILSLHGAGERGTDNEKQVRGSADLAMLFTSEAAQARHPALVVAPQCPEGQQWVQWSWSRGSYDLAAVPQSEAITKALAILAEVQKQYAIDEDRVYVVGLSMGGFGAWDLMLRHADKWAAGVATDGGGAPASAMMMQNLPVWAFHAERDNVVPATGSREMFAALAEVGASPTYTEYATGGHGAWARAAQTRSLFDWLFAQVRNQARSTPPSEIAFSPNGGLAKTLAITSSINQAVIRYTTDGSMPSQSQGLLYERPIEIGADVTLRAVAFQPGAPNGASVFHAATFRADADPAGSGGASQGGSGLQGGAAGEDMVDDSGPGGTGASTPQQEGGAAGGGTHPGAGKGCGFAPRTTGSWAFVMGLCLAVAVARERRRFEK